MHDFSDANGSDVKPFPVLHEPGMRGSPSLMKMKNNDHFHILSMAANGHLYLIDGKDACTEVVDIGLGAGLYPFLFYFIFILFILFYNFP